VKTSPAPSLAPARPDAVPRSLDLRGAFGALGLDAALLLGSWALLLDLAAGEKLTPTPFFAALAAALAYLGDHLLDARRLDPRVQQAVRHGFTRRFRRPLEGLWLLLAVTGIVLALRLLPTATFRPSLLLASMTLLYLFACRYWPRIWRAWPPRELAVGLFFALGLAVLAGGALKRGDLVIFALVCALDAFAVAVRERETDRAQNELSSATRWPRLGCSFSVLALGIALLGGMGAWLHLVSGPVALAVVGAGVGLALVESQGRRSWPVDLVVTVAAWVGIVTHHVL
jgi:hypothetical protein